MVDIAFSIRRGSCTSTAPVSLRHHAASRSLAHYLGPHADAIPAVYPTEVVLESCLWRDYTPARESYALGSVLTPRSYLGCMAESDIVNRKLPTRHGTTHACAKHHVAMSNRL